MVGTDKEVNATRALVNYDTRTKKLRPMAVLQRDQALPPLAIARPDERGQTKPENV